MICPDELETEREAALAQHRGGALNEAEAAYRIILAQHPSDAETYHLLGILQGQKGDLIEAERLIRQAIRLDSTVGRYFGNLGVTMQDLGRDEEALEQFQKAADIDPDSPDSLNDLGACMSKTGRNTAAVTTLKRALELAPAHAAACANLAAAYGIRGFTHTEQGEFVAAVDAYHAATHLLPDDPQANNDLGCALRNIGKHVQAIGAFQHAVELQTHYPEALTNLGNAFQELGRFADATAAYHKALKLQDDDPTIYAYLAEAKTFAPGDSDFEHMLALAQSNQLSQAAQGQLEFALAKACEDMGDFDAAYTHLAAANGAIRGNFDYDIFGEERRIARIIDLFDGRMIGRFDGHGATTERPIFIIGMPRSGTSLAEQILASHRDIFGAGELPDFQRAALALAKGRYPDGMSSVAPREINEFAARYLDVLNDRNTSAKRVTDKLPANFLYVGLIFAAFPQARVIHCVRDPLDTCISCYRKFFARSHRFTYDLEELGRYYRAYSRLMEHWQRLFPKRIFELSYEAVIGETESTIRSLVGYCGLDWDEACMHFYETERPVQTASAAQVRRPLFADSIGAWRRYADHLEPLRAALEPGPAAGQL